MHEPEVTALAPDGLAFVCTIEAEVEKRVVITRKIIPRPSCNLLISWHEWRSNVVGKEISLCCRVQELNDIAVAHDATTTSFRKCLCRDNLPPVVLVGMTITSDLLTYKESDLHIVQKFVMCAYLGYLYGHHRSAMGNARGVSVGKLWCLCVLR